GVRAGGGGARAGWWHVARRPGSGSGGPSDDQARVAPVTVIVGEEELLVERAVRDVVAGWGGGGGSAGEAGRAAPDVHDVGAADLKPGDLARLTPPLLFGGGGLVGVRWGQGAGKGAGGEPAPAA